MGYKSDEGFKRGGRVYRVRYFSRGCYGDDLVIVTSRKGSGGNAYHTVALFSKCHDHQPTLTRYRGTITLMLYFKSKLQQFCIHSRTTGYTH